MHAFAGFIKHGDVVLFYLFNRKLRCQALNSIMRMLTQLGSTLFSIFISALILIPTSQNFRITGIHLAGTLLGSQCIVQSVKRLVDRPRPYKTLENAIAMKPPACQYSFPSGHTCAAFSIAFVLSLSIPALQLPFIALATLVGISRIYLGFHYPTDVVAGIVIAYVSYLSIASFLLPYFIQV